MKKLILFYKYTFRATLQHCKYTWQLFCRLIWSSSWLNEVNLSISIITHIKCIIMDVHFTLYDQIVYIYIIKNVSQTKFRWNLLWIVDGVKMINYSTGSLIFNPTFFHPRFFHPTFFHPTYSSIQHFSIQHFLIQHSYIQHFSSQHSSIQHFSIQQFFIQHFSKE